MPDLSRRQWVSSAVVALFLVGWAVVYFHVRPDEIVDRLGVENAYALVFLLSVIGALGSMTTFSSYPALVGFAAGGMNVFVLAAVSAVGLTLGDAIFFRLAGEVKGLLGSGAREKAERVQAWLEERPGWVVPWATYVWVGFLPLANNILTGALALTGYRFRRIAVPVFLGNFTFPLGVAWLATMGIELFG